MALRLDNWVNVFSLKTAPSKVNEETYAAEQDRQAEVDSDGEDLSEGDENEIPDHYKNDEKVSYYNQCVCST